MVLKWRRPEDRESLEFVYLFSYCLNEVRRVFGPPRELILDDAEGASPASVRSGEPYVLLFGPENVLLGRASLLEMRRCVQAGAGVAVPTVLSDTDLPRQVELFTLRDYEKAEQEFLKRGSEERQSVAGLSPVALFRRRAFDELIEHCSLAEILGGSELSLSLALRAGASYAGICHRFIDYYGQAHEPVMRLMPSRVRSVLDVGCGRGMTGSLIKERLRCRVVGVELNPEVAQEAALRLDRVLQGDVQRLDPGEQFDVVLALELFEHLTENERFLRRAAQWLYPQGRIILSVPNVGHYSVVEDLVAGHWDYLPIGLICYTHYRFFTRRTLVDWLESAGFDRFEILPERTPLPERVRRFAGELEPDWESLSTVRFYVSITPPGCSPARHRKT